MGPQRYQVLLEPSARKSLNTLPRDAQQRIVRRMEALAIDPRPSGVVKLSGHDAYRIRIGDYRVIYTIADERLIVLVVRVGNRRDVYRGY